MHSSGTIYYRLSYAIPLFKCQGDLLPWPRGTETLGRECPETPQDLIELCTREAQVALSGLVSLLAYAQKRLSTTATRLPISQDQGRLQSFEIPYDVPTEMWEVLTESSTALGELIDRLQAASVVDEILLRNEFPELRAAARATGRTAQPCRSEPFQPTRGGGRDRNRQKGRRSK